MVKTVDVIMAVGCYFSDLNFGCSNGNMVGVLRLGLGWKMAVVMVVSGNRRSDRGNRVGRNKIKVITFEILASNLLYSINKNF